jgi:hypothetical protein
MNDPRQQPGILVKLFLARNTSASGFFSRIRSGRFQEIMKNARIIPGQEVMFDRRHPSAGILEKSKGARNRVGIGLSYREAEFLNFKESRNRFQGMNSASLCSLAGR